MDSSTDATVLIVDDDPQIGFVFADFLEDRYEVRLARSGEAALDEIDEEVDVVLLDRRMEGLSGADVLERFRETGFDQPVALVTAVEPDFDILDMGFDDYLVKPVTSGELRTAVETILLRQEYDEVIREFFSLASKVAVLQREKSEEELADNAEFAETAVRLDDVKEQARIALEMAMENGKFEDLFRDLVDGDPDAGVAFGESGTD